MYTAHYFKSKKEQYVIISNTLQPIGKRIDVTSKVEARRIAAAHNAKPWNF